MAEPDVVNRAVVQVALMVSQEFHVSQKLLAVDLVDEPLALLRSEIEEEPEAVVGS
jgi:hypothetical protein